MASLWVLRIQDLGLNPLQHTRENHGLVNAFVLDSWSGVVLVVQQLAGPGSGLGEVQYAFCGTTATV